MDKNEITLLIDSLNGNRTAPSNPEAAFGLTMEQLIASDKNMVFLLNDALVSLMVNKQEEYSDHFVPAASLDSINNGLLGTYYGVNVYGTWVYQLPRELPADDVPRFGMYSPDKKQILPLGSELIVK